MPVPDSTPRLVSLRTIATQGGEVFDWHEHPFHEFSLVTEDATLIAYPSGWRDTEPNTLLHYRPGERHGAWVSPRQKPRFWVVHFHVPAKRSTGLDAFEAKAPEKRVWPLSSDQVETFQWMFLQLVNERNTQRDHNALATSAWLQLMLVNVHRWTKRSRQPELHASTRPTPEVLRLWHLINESVGKSNDETGEIYASRNYDSTRHAFRRTFGCSPREMLLRLRMEHARNLLLETSLSIKEISQRIGYARQHEFYRAFHRHAGCAPSE